ncbi:MAG: OB-fold nucleic acid binding domain-containing protein, partial [Verrucomicrobiota bacterium]
FMIYQEQVMKAAQLLAGYSLGDADLLRRAMGKKKKEVMDQQRERFIKGCAEKNDIPKAQAQKIFQLLEKFAGYGFNKSHSAAYALISYQTAFLKANYPVPFLAALMSNDLDNTDKIALFIGEAKEMEITVLPPSVNHSSPRFSIEDNKIRYGLAAIKGVGQTASEAISAARENGGPFQSMADFCQRVEFRAINKKTVEALVKCGAFEEISKNRAGLFEQIDKCLAQASSVARDLESGQGMFFLDEDPKDQADALHKEIDSVAPWPLKECLAAEKDLLGYYFSGHPIDEYEEDLRAFRTLSTVELNEEPDQSPVRLAGLLMAKEVRIAQRSQKPFARLQLEDRTGAFEIMIWPEMYQEIGEKLNVGTPIIIEGVVDRSREEQLRVNTHKVLLLEEACPDQIREIYVLAKRDECQNGLFPKIKALLGEHPGDRPLCLVIPGEAHGAAVLEAGEAFQLDAHYPVLRKLRELMGPNRVKLRVKDMSEPPPRKRFFKKA